MTKSGQSCSQLVTQNFLHLIPFSLSIALYAFARSNYFYNNQWISIAVKCLPIYSLALFVYLKGSIWKPEYRYHKRIFLGILFSSVGDICLDYGADFERDNGPLLPPGMGFFAVAQILYITAFGWKELKLSIGLPLYAAGGFAVWLMLENLPPLMKNGMPVYAILILTMVWRSLARINSCNLPKVFAGIGGVSFLISDGLIAFDQFYFDGIDNSKVFIMNTYYLAQFGFALSVVDHDVTPSSPKKKKK